jgi:hypothetical protein
MHSYEIGVREKKVFGLGMKEKWVVKVAFTRSIYTQTKKIEIEWNSFEIESKVELFQN